MKKLLSLLFVFTLVACGGSDDDDTADEEQLFLEKNSGISWELVRTETEDGENYDFDAQPIGRVFVFHPLGSVFFTSSECENPLYNRNREIIISHTNEELTYQEEGLNGVVTNRFVIENDLLVQYFYNYGDLVLLKYQNVGQNDCEVGDISN